MSKEALEKKECDVNKSNIKEKKKEFLKPP